MISPPHLKEKNGIFLAIDLGTETIKSLIFKKEKEKNIILGASLKDYYALGIEGERIFEKEKIKEAVSEVISQAQKQAKVKAKDCSVVLRVPGSFLKERIVLHSFQRKNHQRIIDRKEENSIYQKILKEGQEKISKEIFQEIGILSQDLHFLDFKILERKIDGYEVEKMEGFSGQNLDFRTLFVCLPKDYFKNIGEIAKSLKLHHLGTISEVENLHSAFSIQKITAIFLDIGGRLTKIFLMEKGEPQAVESFEMGGEIFTQKLSQALGIDKAQAEDLKIRYAQRVLSDEVRKRIREPLSLIGQTWFNSLKLKLKEISGKGKGIFPSIILIFGGGSLLPEIKEILESNNWEDLPFLEEPQIKPLLLKDLKNIEDKKNIINTIQYIPSLLLCYV